MVMTQMSVCTLQDAAASAALVAGVSLVSTPLVEDWATVSTPARHSFKHISLLQLGTKILCSMLFWVSVSTQLVKCHICWAVRP